MDFWASKHRNVVLTVRDAPDVTDAGPFVFLALHIADHVVGDLDQAQSARPLAWALRRIADKRGARKRNALPLRQPRALYDQLDRWLFVDDGATDDDIALRWSTYSPHLALPLGVESFDGWKAFLAETDDEAVFVARNLDEQDGFIYHMLEPNEYELTLRQGADWLDGLAGP